MGRFKQALLYAGTLVLVIAVGAGAQIGYQIRSTTVTVTGQLELADGSAGDPSIVFPIHDEGTPYTHPYIKCADPKQS